MILIWNKKRSDYRYQLKQPLYNSYQALYVSNEIVTYLIVKYLIKWMFRHFCNIVYRGFIKNGKKV